MSRRAGFTVIEVMVALVVLMIAIGAAALVGLRSQGTLRAESVRLTLDAQVRETLAKLSDELRGSNSGSITALPESVPGNPQWGDQLQFDSVDSINSASGVIAWSTSRIELQLDTGEVDDDVDNNGNGLVDEGRLVLIRDWGGVNEVSVVLTRWVADHFEGETFNAVDDNGNGLIDERGFSIERSGSTLTLRLALQQLDSDGRLVTRSAETSVRLRN